MKSSIRTTIPDVRPLREATQIGMGKVLNPQVARDRGDFGVDHPALVILAAGKGTRFGRSPKCAQAICGMPLGRHSIEAFRCISQSPAVCVVGYCHEEVMAALGEDNLYVLSDCPTGGTAFAAYEALSFPELVDANALLVITMGDRIVTESIFEKLVQTHLLGPREADLTLLTAIYEVPKHHGKGRLVRDSNHRVLRIIEQRDIDTMHDSPARQRLQETTEGNCPLYAIRAETLNRHLSSLTNQNAQGQYYFTDIVETISREGGDIRTITTTTADPEYDLLCSDVTRPMDLALLEGILASARSAHRFQPAGVDDVARAICAGRPAGQVAAIAAQLDELTATAARDELGYRDDQPVGIGVSGGRLRIAFMHPDMGRFFGPAWQMPFGAKNASGREQIVIVVQSSDDGEIHLYPAEPQFRERLNSVAADTQCMYPGDEIADWYSYEDFGTRMAENILLSLGYFTDDELASRREQGLPLPPASLWLANSMRRPFSLIGNAIASMRTLREGNLGAKVQTYLGRDGFRGLRVMSTGNIPQGGFSSSSAVTVAVKNAINALFDLGISPDMLVHLACQAEYGTGVRAGALDQATEQKGRLKQGTLISSNPRENYRILGTYPVPTDRFHVLFVYSVDRDRVAWRWSAGTYAESPEPGRLTTAQMRKMTGKASELAAILTRLPLDTDYFQRVEDDLLTHGQLGKETTSWVCDQLKQIPLHATRDDLRAELRTCRRWYVEQLANVHRMSAGAAGKKADATIEALFSGWRDPLLLRTTPAGEVVEENGIPLRAIVAYLFGEVAKNFYLIFHPDAWITCISQSQNGDRCFAIDPGLLPPCDAMKQTLDWESGASGPTLMERWLDRFGATPFDFNRGLDDEALSADPLPSFHRLEGSNFFRGLALVDLAEAMLKRAFGSDAVAVRINAAGQGDYFQVHIDTTKVDVEEVKQFIEMAFFRRFSLASPQPFVETYPGGGAVGVRLSRFDALPNLVRALRAFAGMT